MNINNHPVSRDEKHLGISVPKSKILEKVISSFGRIPMAKFYSGSWRGTHYKVVPLNKWIKIPIPKWLSDTGEAYIWTPPYANGSKVDFKIVVTKFEALATPLNKFELVEMLPQEEGVVTEDGKEVKKRIIDRINTLSDNETEFRSDMESKCHRVGSYFRYYFGQPGTDDKKLIVETVIVDFDNFYMGVFLPYIMPIILATVFGAIGFFIREIINWIKSLP